MHFSWRGTVVVAAEAVRGGRRVFSCFQFTVSLLMTCGGGWREATFVALLFILGGGVVVMIQVMACG